jgi:hypothetical protein
VGAWVVEADLRVDPPVERGSTQAYALCTVRNYVMAIDAGCSEDQVFGVVVDGIDRATAVGAAGSPAGAWGLGDDPLDPCDGGWIVTRAGKAVGCGWQGGSASEGSS